MSQGALEGVRIVDLGGSIAGMAATMVLAEMGADVVLVEPVGGSHWRPLPGFVTWNRSKRAWNFGDLEVRLELAPPLLGEHTVEVLLEVGLDRAEID